MMERLSANDLAYLMACLSEYYFTGEIDTDEVEENSLPVALILDDAIDRMDADKESYERLVKTRSEAGKKGMEKRWANNKAITTDNTVITDDNTAITNDNKGITNDNKHNGSDSDSVNKEKVITNVITKEKEPKHQYGDYKHVLLSDKELEKLNADYGIDKTAYAIKWFDAYIEEKGYKCKSYSLAMRRWVFDAIERDKKQPVSRSGTTKANWNIEKRDYDMEDLEAQLLRRSL